MLPICLAVSRTQKSCMYNIAFTILCVCVSTVMCSNNNKSNKKCIRYFFYQQAAKIIDTLYNTNQVQVSKAHVFLRSKKKCIRKKNEKLHVVCRL